MREKKRLRPAANGKYQTWWDGDEWYLISPDGDAEALDCPASGSWALAVGAARRLNADLLGTRWSD